MYYFQSIIVCVYDCTVFNILMEIAQRTYIINNYISTTMINRIDVNLLQQLPKCCNLYYKLCEASENVHSSCQYHILRKMLCGSYYVISIFYYFSIDMQFDIGRFGLSKFFLLIAFMCIIFYEISMLIYGFKQLQNEVHTVPSIDNNYNLISFRKMLW